MIIGLHHFTIDLMRSMHQVMVTIPINANINKDENITENITEKHREQGFPLPGHLHAVPSFPYHDGDDDGKHPITECF